MRKEMTVSTFACHVQKGTKQAHVTHRALLRKGTGNGAADACGRASHDGDLAFWESARVGSESERGVRFQVTERNAPLRRPQPT
jgi:hypothetical protein